MTVIEKKKLGDVFMGRAIQNEIGVYMIRQNIGAVIYVGSCQTIDRRIRVHHKRDNSPLWQAITEGLPASMNWWIDIILFEPDQAVAYKMRQKEAELIKEHKPRLNTYMQPEPTVALTD